MDVLRHTQKQARCASPLTSESNPHRFRGIGWTDDQAMAKAGVDFDSALVLSLHGAQAPNLSY